MNTIKLTREKAKAFVFDADGTLFNSFELLVAAYKHVAETHNLRVPSPAEVRLQLGKALPDIFRTFYPDHNVEELLQTNNTFVAANIMRSEAYEGLEDLLQSLQALGLKLAILTSGGAKVMTTLEHHGVTEHFSSIVHYQRITRPKPDPEGFLLAVEECQVEPHEAVMIGDTATDILTGKNGSALTTIGITHGYGQREDLVATQADYIVDSLLEVNQLAKRLCS